MSPHLLLNSLSSPLAMFSPALADMQMDHVMPILSMLAPFVFVIIIVAIKSWEKARRRQLNHETIRLALEKGQAIPAELLMADADMKCRGGEIGSGVILIAVGIGLFVFLANFSSVPSGVQWVGVIPFAIGVARLVVGLFLARKRRDESLDGRDS